MSLEFIDGFDHYNNSTNIARKWDSVSTIAGSVAGRFAGNAFNFQNATATVALTAVGTRVCGFAFQCTNASLPNSILVAYLDAGTAQVELRLTSTGALSVTRNGTAVGTSAAGVIVFNTWNYIEWKCAIGSSAAYEVRVNGTSVLSGTGNTQNTANSTVSQFRIGLVSNTAQMQFDDLYVLNTSGSANNDFLGECRVYTSLPTGDDASFKQWTPSTGTNHFANVDENPPTDDTDFNSSATVGQIDLCTFPSISPTGLIAAVQSVLLARKDDVGTRQICEECRSSSTNYDGANTFTMTSSYLMYRQIRETDPATSAAWTSSGVNAAEFGAKVLA